MFCQIVAQQYNLSSFHITIIWLRINHCVHYQAFSLIVNFKTQCDVETATGVYSCLSLDMQVRHFIDQYKNTSYDTLLTKMKQYIKGHQNHASPSYVHVHFEILCNKSSIFLYVLQERSDEAKFRSGKDYWTFKLSGRSSLTSWNQEDI